MMKHEFKLLIAQSITHSVRISDLHVIAGFLAVGDSLDLGGGGEVQSLTQVREAECSGDAHVRQRQVVHIQQRP